jgi:fibronectin-binding autotransporter adhesin
MNTRLEHAIRSLFVVGILSAAIGVTQAQTLYSRSTPANWNTTTAWSTTAGGASCACYPGDATHTTGWSAVVSAGHVITLPSTAYTLNSIVNLTVNGTLTFGTNGGTSKTLSVTSDLTVSAGSTFNSGNTTATAHVLQIGGDLINNGTFNQTVNSPTNQSVTFNGSGGQDVSGTGSFIFRNITVGGATGNVNINSSVLINGPANALTFSADRLLNVSATSNVTLGTSATVSGANSSRYIQLDGSTSAGSQLIKTNAGSTASWRILFPIGTSSGGYTPVDLTTSTITNAPASGNTLAVKAIYNNSIQGQLRRTFRLISNAGTTTFSNPRFYINSSTDVSAGDALANYTGYWYLNSAGGSWSTLTGSITDSPGGNFPTNPPGYYFSTSTGTQALFTGTYYYTMGSSTAYPNTWYSYQTGVWSNWQNWTLDPSGTTLVNGLNLPPQPGDAIVILNGLIITNDVSGQVASSATINSGGTLDMATTIGNTLGTVSGSGLLRVSGVSLPTGTYTSFVLTTGGTIEYYNIGGTLPTAQATYNKLILSNNTGSAITYTTANDLTVNSDFNISQTGGAGTVTWMINNATANRRILTLNGDLVVSASGRIRASSSGLTNPHALELYGNLTNNGSIKFFDDTDVHLDADADYTGGSVYTRATKVNSVNVTFSGTSNQTVTCNNTTDFYRFIVDKGTGQQAVLTVNSSNTANFRLFGPANIATVESGGAANFVSSNALSIVNGTLELKGSINIPVLQINTSTTGYFPIPRNGALWLNSPNVTVQITDMTTDGFAGTKDGRILISGLLRITDGTLNDGFSKGLGSQDGGSYLQEGGTVNCWQFRPRSIAGDPPFSFTQSGGTLNVGYGYALSGGKIDQYEEDYARFDLRSANSTFEMSGNAVLNVAKPTSNVDTGVDGGLFLVASTASNISVTGGTVNLYAGVERSTLESYPAYINSTAPFYNLNIYEESATTQTVQLQTNSLVVLNNLTIHTVNSPSFITNNLNVTIGKDLIIESGTTYTAGTGITTFNGSSAQNWTNDGTITSPLTNVVVNKSAGTVTLGGTTHATFLNAAGTGTITNLTITSGTLADNGKTINVTGTLSNSGTHSGAGGIVANGPTAIGGSNGTFGNLTITTNATVTTAGDQTVTGNLRLASASSSLNIQSNSLTVNGSIYDAATGITTAGFSATKRIQTAGLRNDGGLTRQGAAGDLLFPLGVTGAAAYTPNTINVAATTQGKITVRPVSGPHPNLPAASGGQSLAYYWRVTSTGFSEVSSATHKSYNYGSATLIQGTASNYRVARYDASTFAWTSAFAHTASGIIIYPATFTFDFGTNIDGEYTSGNIATVNLTVYYSKTDGGLWSAASTWSTLVGRGNTASSAPCATCPVVIGDGSAFNHTVEIDANGITSGSLQIYSGSTLDCNTFTSLNFGVNTNQSVSGTGTLKIAAVTAGNGVFPSGDFTNFIGPTGGTVEWYGNTKVLPTTSPNGLVLDNFYNLTINPSTGQTITLPASNLTVYNLFLKSGAGTAATNVAATRAITFKDFNVSDGTFSILTGSGFISNFSLSGNLTIGATGTLSASGAAVTHTLTTTGNITNNGILNLRNTSLVNLAFTGSTNTSFSGTGTQTRLNNLTLNKGIDQTYVLTVDVAGTSMQTLTTGWLTLTNGTINFNNAPAAGYSLNTASSAYSIPSTARLKVQQGTVTIVNATNDAADLLLNGTLEVAGGTVNVGSSANNNNNDIEYASAGTPTIIVSGGTLYVNGAVRRSTTTLSGALVYNQSAGTVTVGGRNCDANETRGVFEIENNTGSGFDLTGGVLTVQRTNNGTAFADLYINPATSSVLPSGTIQMGLTSTPETGFLTMSMNIAPSIGNFSILSAGAGATNAQVVDMQSSELTTLGTLTINANSTLQTNALDVNIGGNLSITGIYNGTIAGGNTTTFNGAGAQNGTLTPGSTFQNITINKSAGTATLDGNSTINNLNILNGTLSVTNTLDINSDIVNNSTQIGGGILNMAGASTTHTITSSNGSFGNLNLGGSSTTKTVNVSGNMTVTGTLNFTTSGTSRYLNIGSNKLTFSPSGTINPANIGATRFIKTNGVASDFGVVKDWPVGTNSFTYAVGTRTNYTPVIFTGFVVTTAGNMTVAPVDSQHPTATAIGEQILNYYWIVKGGSTIVFNPNVGTHAYQFPSGFIGGSGGTLVAAHLDAINLIGWTRPPDQQHGGTINSPTNTIMTFTNANILLPQTINLPSANGEFHYSIGTIATLTSPVTPLYSRIENAATVGNVSIGGSWNTDANWTVNPSGSGCPCIAPAGRPVVILPTARINMDFSGLSAFSSKIDGLLVITNSTGHNLGSISGIGTLRASSSTLPAGNYTSFVSSAGGTIEYFPTPAVDINMNSRTDYNNLRIAGTNVVTMTNVNLNLNGSLTIVAGATLNNVTNNRDLAVAGSISNAGTFSQGAGTVNLTGNMANAGTYNQSSGITNLGGDWSNTGTYNAGMSTLNFNGSAALQAISGTNSFYNLSVSKPSGNVTLNALTTVTNLLTLTTGKIISTTGSPLVLTTTASSTAGNANSFVSVPMLKTFNGSFTFPVGSVAANRYRPATVSATSASDTWTVEYVGNNPTLQGYTNTLFNSANLGKVSQYEYWNVSRVGATTAALELTYNTGSYVVNASNIGNVANLRIARWNGSQWDVPVGASSVTQTGTTITGTVKVSVVSNFSPFTFGSTDPDSPLPITLMAFNAKLNNDHVDLTWKTAQEINNDYFVIEKTTNLESFTEVGKIEGNGSSKETHSYSLKDSNPSAGRSYYRLKQVDYDGEFSFSELKMIDYDGPQFATLRAYPSPLKEDVLNIEVLGLKDTQFVPLKIYNLQGQILFQRVYDVTIPGQLTEKVSFGRQLAPGLYIVKAGSTIQLTQKIVVE